MSWTEVERRREVSSWSRRVAVLLLKLAVTALCLWYLARQTNLAGFVDAARTLDGPWLIAAALLLTTEIPLVALRWCWIVDALDRDAESIARTPLIAITAITNFFSQVMPNVASDGLRAWMLVRRGRSWRDGILSVVIDRMVGLGGLIAVGFCILLIPGSGRLLDGHRGAVLAVFAAVLSCAIIGLLLVPLIAPPLERWRYTAWAGMLARATYNVLLGSRVGLGVVGIALSVHLMTILTVWLLGKSLLLPLSPLDAGVLFTAMIAAALLPVSIGGWGIREVAVTSLLQRHGVNFDQALFFSVCFGLIVLIAALPGAVVWAVYSPARATARWNRS